MPQEGHFTGAAEVLVFAVAGVVAGAATAGNRAVAIAAMASVDANSFFIMVSFR